MLAIKPRSSKPSKKKSDKSKGKEPALVPQISSKTEAKKDEGKPKKRKRMSGADISALLADKPRGRGHQGKGLKKPKLPASLRGAVELDLPGLPPGVILYERPLPPLPEQAAGNTYVPRVDGTFSLPCEFLGPIEQKAIERACAIQPKDMSSFYGGKPPDPYPTTEVIVDEEGVSRLHVKRATGYALWGKAAPKDVSGLGKRMVKASRMAFGGKLCDGTSDTPPQRQAVDRVLRFLKARRASGAAPAPGRRVLPED